MITIKNTQRTIAIDAEKVKAQLEQILAILGYADFDLGLWITSNATIRRFNREFRHKDKPTDILSFPYHPELKAGKRIKARSDEDKNLGDLIISAAYVVKDAPRYNMNFEERLCVLLVHGVCHLLGYDHMTDQDWRRMRAKEAYILKNMK